MCGIAIVLSMDSKRVGAFLDASISALHHRGPDGQGQWQGEGVGLAHTRLAILDLSTAGAQPMWSESGRFVITYNGEIYNHLELRQKYFPGKRWRGHSDTETLLALFEKSGSTMFTELVGMWALAIWDTLEKRLLLSRDRYGQKPLYYRFYQDGSFAAASEIKPLLIPGHSNSANPLMVAEYLALGNYGHLGSQTFFKDIFQISPAHYTEIKLGEKCISEIPYWQLPKINRKDKIPFGTTQEYELRKIITDAVDSQLLSDVPVGATLSGGIDSSCICGIIANKLRSTPFSVFTAQTQGSPLDETMYVNEVIKKWGDDRLKIYTKELKNIRLQDSLHSIINIQEEPFGDPSILAHSFLMDMAKEYGIKVILGGQGADELFFGYPSMIFNLLTYELNQGNWQYVKNEKRQLHHSVSTARLFLGAIFPNAERVLRLQSREKRRFVLSEKFQSLVKDQTPKISKLNNFNDIWEESIFKTHLPHLLHYDDRNSMSRSIEGRMPFMDHRIAEFLSGIQTDNFLRNGETKVLLKSSCSMYIPDSVLKRKDKIGFFTPLDDYVRNENKWIREVIYSSKIDALNLDIVDENLKFYEGTIDSAFISQRIWRWLNFVMWSDMFKIYF